MTTQKSNKEDYLCIHLKGDFYFHGNNNPEFVGPVVKGLRILFWGKSYKHPTSCSFVKDKKVFKGQTQTVELVLLSPQSIDRNLEVSQTYSVGFPGMEIGKFTIQKILGKWEGKVP